MAKAKLKPAEPTLEDELDVAIAAEASARAELQKSEAAFKVKYPGDVKAYMNGFTMFEDQAPLPKGISQDVANQLSAERHSQQMRDFNGDWNALRGLGRLADDAERRVRALRLSLSEAIDEKEARARLSDAIKNAGTAAAEVERLRGAVSRIDATIKDAEQSHSDATRAVAEATAAQTRLYEAAVEQGHPPAPDDTVRDARRAAESASEAVTAAKAAAPGLKAKLAQAEGHMREANEAVLKWARWTASTSIPRLLEEARAVQLELEGRRLVLSVLSSFGSTDHDVAATQFLEDLVFPFGHKGELATEHPAVASWLVAVDALSRDAGAPLPEA